jgi:hypothetical protein
MINYKELFIGIGFFIVAQTLSWYQTNGQFISTWIKDNPFLVTLVMGVPIGLSYIHGTNHIVTAFGGTLWSARLMGFATGVFSFSFLAFFHVKEGINIKTATILVLAAVIMTLQIFWKIDK